LEAIQIVDNPQIEVEGRYLIIGDTTILKQTFQNLNKAINIMAERGWKCINLTSVMLAGGFTGVRISCYALMERED